jgi:hypothetical protein
VEVTYAEDVPAADETEEKVLAAERLEQSRRLSRILSGAIKQVSKADRQMLVLRFKLGMTVAEISRSIRIEQRLLYPRMSQLMDALRAKAERAGFDRDAVVDLIGREGLQLDFDLGTPDVGPSTPNGEKSRDASDDTDDDA